MPPSWFPRALLPALSALLLTACGAPTGPTGGHDQLHASCFQLLTGQAATLTPAAFSATDVASPTPSPAPPAPTRRWSDAAGWPGGALPAQGDAVTIPAGEAVLLDVAPPPLGRLSIHGDLVFDRQDLELAAAAIEVHGGLYVGSAAQPFTHKAVIRVGGATAAGASDCFGSNYLGLVNGTLELYGNAEGPAWTRLSATAPEGATSIEVDDARGWLPGDRIVIANTDFYPWGDASAGNEERTLTRVEANTLYFEQPLRYQHYGTSQTFGAGTGLPTTVLESRAEVARLTRNVRVTGPEASAQQDAGQWGDGAHIMALGGSRVRLDSVELTAMGQAGQLMRYPVHFHLQGNAAYGSFVRNSSLHHLYNRCVTIHGSRGVLLQDNAAYDTFGHCYFFEDGAETGNVLLGNLGMLARAPAGHDRLLPTDDDFQGPSIFWVTNPDNVLVGNVAASSQGSGFWYSLPQHPTGPSYDIFGGAQIWPRRTPLGQFKDNLAHSNRSDGLHVDRGPAAGTLRSETAAYRPRAVPADPDSAPVPALFQNFVAYKHRQDAAWFRGDSTFLTGALLVDNAVGVTFASNASGMLHSVVVGESANNPGQPPRNWAPQFAVRGFQFYDGTVHVADSHFEGFTGQSAALSINDFTSFSLSPRSYASGLTFAAGTNRVTFTKPGDLTRTEEAGADGYSSGLFVDLDGSVTGSRGVHVTVANQLLERAGCTTRAAWNAQLCPGPYAALTLRNQDAHPSQLGPVKLTRSSGQVHTLYGTPRTGANTHFRSVVPLGYDYAYDFGPATSGKFTLELSEAAPADTLLVSLPYAGQAPFVYRDWWIDQRSLLDSYPSLAALSGAPDTGYYHDGRQLYLKLVVQDRNDWAHLTVCRRAGCP